MRLVIAYQMLGYGSTIHYGARRSAEPAATPGGEPDPPLDHWLALWIKAPSSSERKFIVGQARAELKAWKVRQIPPPQGETGEAMVDRMMQEGEGWTARDVALAFRCTPSLVRRWRSERDRDPETGRLIGTMAQARDLLEQGMTLRQVAMLTGIPKSTIHERLDRAA